MPDHSKDTDEKVLSESLKPMLKTFPKHHVALATGMFACGLVCCAVIGVPVRV